MSQAAAPASGQQTEKAQSNSGVSTFVGGFTVGMLLGVAGYYLFGTKQGERVSKKIVQEWRQAETVTHTPVGSAELSSHWQSAFSKLAKELGFHRRRQTVISGKTVKQSAFIKKNRPHKKPQSKFAGT